MTFSKNTEIKFHENPPSGNRVPCGQTDGRTNSVIEDSVTEYIGILGNKIIPKTKQQILFMVSALHTEYTVSQCIHIVRYMIVENGLGCIERNFRDFTETKLKK